MGEFAERKLIKLKHINFISNDFDYKNIFKEFIRICKPLNLYIFCSNKQISRTMEYFEKKDYRVTLLVWHKQNADKLEQIVKDRNKYIEQLNSEWWDLFKDIQEKEKYLKDNNTKFQLCKYIDRVEYKYNQLLEENKRLIEENKRLKQTISDDKKYVKKSFFDFLNNIWHGFSL